MRSTRICECARLKKAVSYLLQAGMRAAWLSAYQETISHLSKGLALLERLLDSPSAPRPSLGITSATDPDVLPEQIRVYRAMGRAGLCGG